MIENHHGVDGEEYVPEYPDYGEGCLLQCDCSAECYREDSGHREYRSGQNHSKDFGEQACTGGGMSPCLPGPHWGTRRPGDPWVALPSPPNPVCFLLAE